MAIPLLLIAAVAASQSQASAPPPRPAGGEFVAQRTGRFMSPMGEPFFGQSAGEDGLTAWFRQADRNHDGFLTSDEMQADASRFFATLDTNHDGEIDPDEITHYEDVIAPEVRSGPMPRAQTAAQEGSQQGDRTGGYGGGGGRHGGGRGHRGGGGFGGDGGGFGGGDDEAGAGRYSLLQIPEPVISADSDFNRGVSAQEFQQAAMARFQLLDVDHAGRLSLPGLEAIRQAAASAARKPPRQPSSDDQPIPEGSDPQPMPVAR